MESNTERGFTVSLGKYGFAPEPSLVSFQEVRISTVPIVLASFALSIVYTNYRIKSLRERLARTTTR